MKIVVETRWGSGDFRGYLCTVCRKLTGAVHPQPDPFPHHADCEILALENEIVDLQKKTPESIIKIADEWLTKLEGTGLPCGHKLADLIGGKDAVTKCGACLAELKKRRDDDIAVNHRPYCKAKNPSVCTGGCW